MNRLLLNSTMFLLMTSVSGLAVADVPTEGASFGVSANSYGRGASVDDLEAEATADAVQKCSPHQASQTSPWHTMFVHYGNYWAVDAMFVCN